MKLTPKHIGLQMLLSVMIGLGVGISTAQAQSGDLEPPGSAVNGSGEPTATTQTQPSWDQKLPADERFKLVMGNLGVLDIETGLVWQRRPDSTERTVESALTHCLNVSIGGRKGWRLPSIHEALSLVDPSAGVPGPLLPPEHPFINIQLSSYWSATSHRASGLHRLVIFNPGVAIFQVSSEALTWCVRGGGPMTEY